ncbi:MAG: host attachment protein [Acidobacteriota bacterium]|jgi:protein required for attachment to host cells|nr:host attachment protein [Acidobacteriota bacterium]
MLGRGVLSTLYTLSQQKTYTLTLYLDIDQNKQSNRRRGYVVQGEALIKGLKAQQKRSDRLDAACKQALSLVRDFKPKGKTALIVVHPESRLRELVQIELSFPVSIHWRRGAFLRPVVEAMDEHERYGVVLTDNQRARLFTVVMGELTEHEDLFSETGQRTRSLGADQMRSQKRHDQRHQEEIASHAKRVVDALHDLALRQPYDRLIVGGTPKAAGQLVRLLPTRLRGKLVDTVSMRVGGSQKEVLNKILAVQQRMERDRETEIVQGVLAELHDRGKAVGGFAAVLDAVNQGRVWTLVYGKGYTNKAGECGSCDAYSPHAKGPCVYCGEDVHPLPQCIDRLSQSVVEMGGRVEVVDGDAKKKLEEPGSIAAMLRY